MVCAQFISISRVHITSGDNYRERGLVNRIAFRAQYFLACRGRFESFRRAMNAQRRGKCLRAPPLRPRPHAALFAYAYCDRPDSFFYADHSFLSRALLFFRPLSLSFSFISWRVPVRAHRPTSFRSRGECHRSTNGALITRGMCIRSHSGMRVSSGDVNANRVIQNDSIAQNTVGKIRRLPVEERVSASQLVSTECLHLARTES